MNDNVRILLMLGPVDDGVTFTYTPIMPRWRAIDVSRDFGESIWYNGEIPNWDGRPVLRSLIVPTIDERTGEDV